MSEPPIQVLHVFPTFAPGGAQVRATDLMQAFGPEWRHAVVALDGVVGAKERVAAPIELELIPPPPKAGSFATARWLRGLLARRRPHLVLSYNFGAIDALLAARALSGVRLVHHEDGFGSDEARKLKLRRTWLRRLAFPAAARVVVISRNLERIALETWRQPPARVAYIPNGIDVERFARGAGAGELRHQLGIPARAVVVGSVGHLRPEKNVARLLRAARWPLERGIDLHLLVLGDGPERAALEALAQEEQLAGRVHFVGHQPDPRAAYRAMDVLALPSDTEQQPLALLEAMAAGLPVAATDVGDVRAMLPTEQSVSIVPLDGEADVRLGLALEALARDAALRARLGEANRARARERFRREAMVESYRELYLSILGRSVRPPPPTDA
jgi:glycosyltransferase involved in cell wall biosynthesis